MIRVLNVLTDSNIGGAGRLLVNYLHNFDRSRFDTVVALPRDSRLIPAVKAEGYEVAELEYGRDKSWERRAVKELRRVIRDFDPDIVHTHSSLSARVAAWQCGVPCRFYTRHCASPVSRESRSTDCSTGSCPPTSWRWRKRRRKTSPTRACRRT